MDDDTRKRIAAGLRDYKQAMRTDALSADAIINRQRVIADELGTFADILDPPDWPEPSRASHHS
jgi:hypothetical protein